MKNLEIDLHKIANTSGYGAAEKALRSAGAWDEHGSEDGEPRKFTATVCASMPCSCTVSVVARSEREAEDMIINEVSSPMFAGWNWQDGAEDIDIHFNE